jgi:phage terminase large subunit-like protein
MKETEQELQKLLQALAYKNKYEKIGLYFPDKDMVVEGRKYYSRTKYAKHLKFFELGAKYKMRLFCAANQVGKSTGSLIETTYHLTGDYPKWWKGYRFTKPIRCWAVGQNSDTIRNLLQKRLLGDVGDFGSGMIPKGCLDLDSLKEAKKSSTPITTFRVKHKSGGFSSIDLKTYESGRRAFEGEPVDLIVCDEEPPLDIFTECVTRTVATGGILIINFTPLLGMSDMVLNFLNGMDWSEGEKSPTNYLINCSWDDVPHLTETEKKSLISIYPEYIRDARTKGIPVIGAGNVYTTPEEIAFVDPFAIPNDWKRVFSIDYGFTDPTCILWGALSSEDKTLYIYSEHYVSRETLLTHVEAIKARNKAAGFTIPGVGDPSGGGRSTEGIKAAEVLNSEYGIAITQADNSILPGIMKVQDWLNMNKLKIFKSCVNTLSEYRMYRFDEKVTPTGKPKFKGKDHAMDALRYMVMTGIDAATNESDCVENFAELWNAARIRQDLNW